jgi:hypothetical protein
MLAAQVRIVVGKAAADLGVNPIKGGSIRWRLKHRNLG